MKRIQIVLHPDNEYGGEAFYIGDEEGFWKGTDTLATALEVIADKLGAKPEPFTITYIC